MDTCSQTFFSTILIQDEKAIILRKKATVAVNKITSPEELPENPEIFERDYAYDVNMKNQKLVSFKILIATTKTFSKTFRKGIMYRKLSANEWFVKYIRLESQGTVTEIGNLMYAHNRFVNQADLIQEIRNLIHLTICNEIDILNFFIKGVRDYRSAEVGGITRGAVEAELKQRYEMENNGKSELSRRRKRQLERTRDNEQVVTKRAVVENMLNLTAI